MVKQIKRGRDELIARMHQARAFTDPIVADFLATTEEKFFQQWRNPLTTEKEREELYLQCQGLEAFRKFVKDTIIAGQNAEHDLNRINGNNK